MDAHKTLLQPFIFLFCCFFSYASAALTCVSDNFNGSSIDGNWKITRVGSNTVYLSGGNKLVFTQNTNWRAGIITYQRAFEAANELVEVEFDQFSYSPWGGSGADGIAVIFSDSSVVPVHGGLGGGLGYKGSTTSSGTTGFSGGWLGVAIDDNGYFSIGQGGPGRTPNSVSVRGSQNSNYTYITGSGTLSPGVYQRGTWYSNPNHRYRITIDSRTYNQSLLTVKRDIKDGNGYQTLISSYNVLSHSNQGGVPENFFVTIAGVNGGLNNYHEIDNLSICSTGSAFPLIHHFELSYSSHPLTCNKEIVTVKACQNSSCSNLVTDLSSTVYVTTSDTTVANWERYGEVTMSNGIGTIDLHGYQTSPVTIGVSNAYPQLNNTLCRKGSSSASTANCTFSFADSGFLVDVPDKLANKPVTATISAVKKSDNSLSCTPAMANVTKNTQFWSQYISPATPVNYITSQPQILLGSGETPIGRSESNATTFPLSFNAQGQATVQLNYKDAGKVSLHAKLDRVPNAPDGYLYLTGNDSFVSVPAGLCVHAGSGCNAGNGSCSVFKKAGETFPILLTGMAWKANDNNDLCDNTITPNYSQNNIVLSSNLIAPVGGQNGTVGTTSYNHTQNIELVNQSISEAGVFEFTADPPAGYLGSTATFADIPAGKTHKIGRFVPEKFIVSNISHQPACNTGASGFSYMGQPYNIGFTLSARNSNNQVTRNYISSATAANNFANSSISFVAENADDGTTLSSRLSAAPSLTWANGETTITGHQVTFSRPSVPNKDGPYASFDTGIVITDDDGIASLVGPDMHPSQAGNCNGATNSCTAKKLGTQQQLFGRIFIENAYGTETTPLAMPLRAEYWNGTWLTNQLDNCTPVGTGINQVNPTLTSTTNNSSGYKYEPSLTTGQTVSRTGSGSFNQGIFSLQWQMLATGNASLYRGKITAPLTVSAWLKYYWNWNGTSPNTNADPRGSASIGVYRGNDRILYRYEM